MRKVFSCIVAVAICISCMMAVNSATAAELPALTLEKSVTITAAKQGKDAVKVAAFKPAQSGCYAFACATAYENRPTGSNIVASGSFGIQTENGETVSFTLFSDLSHADENQRKEIENEINLLAEMGIVFSGNTPKFTAELEAGKTYYLDIVQNGAENYTTEITTSVHTHTIKTGQIKEVKVYKNGTSSETGDSGIYYGGGIYDGCEDPFCGYVKYTTQYFPVDSTTVKDAVYSGKAVKPAVTVLDFNERKLDKKYYTVAYENNKKIGKGKAIITFQNGYTGTVVKTFKINPRATTVKKVVAGKKQVKATYQKAGSITGYEVQAATNKRFTQNKKTVVVKGAKKTTATIKKLKGGKKYYVRVRTYKTVDGKKYYSSWSKVKTATVKK